MIEPRPRARYDMRRRGGESPAPARKWDRLRRAALTVPATGNPLDLWGRAGLWAVLAYYGFFYVGLSISRSQTRVSVFDYILSMANLVFHEAGHVILAPLGEFMSVLGGSLLQVLIPLGCLAAFLAKPDGFAASVTMWWGGQSLIDLAPYIGDARAQRLVLLGGVTGREHPGYHDWNNLLARLGLLEYDQVLARAVDGLGSLLILASLGWGAYLLLRLHQSRLTPTTPRGSDPYR